MSGRVVNGIHALLNNCLEQAMDLMVEGHKKHPGNPYMFPSPKAESSGYQGECDR